MTSEKAIKTIRGAWSLMCQTNIRFDFVVDYREAAEMAISALKEIQQYRETGLTPELIQAMKGHNNDLIEQLAEYQEIGTVEACREAVEKQKPKKPIWKQEIGIVHKDYADGHGETVEEKWADWVCPNCGCFVGEQYIPRRHNQRKSNYCSRCGQKINWSENLEGMEE